jgi:hypothetical protein
MEAVETVVYITPFPFSPLGQSTMSAAAGAGATPLICVPEDAEETLSPSLCVPEKALTASKSRLEELTEAVTKCKERKLANERAIASWYRIPGQWTAEQSAQYAAQGPLLLEYNAAVRALEAETNKQRLLALEDVVDVHKRKMEELERISRTWYPSRMMLCEQVHWEISSVLHEKDRTIARLEHEVAVRKHEMESIMQRTSRLECKTATLTQLMMQILPHISGCQRETSDDRACLDLS